MEANPALTSELEFELPKRLYEQAWDFQADFQQFLFQSIVNDDERLYQLAVQGAETDLLTRQLWDLRHLDKQPTRICITRNDYFLTQNDELKMTEYNTMSITVLHAASLLDPANNPILDRLAAELLKVLNPGAVILLLMTAEDSIKKNVEIANMVAYLQRLHGFTIMTDTLDCQLSVDVGGHLIYNQTTIAMVWLRSGYVEMTPQEYENRQVIEASRAIKLPNARWQLAGSKLVQCRLMEDPLVPALFKKLNVRQFHLPGHEHLLSEQYILKNLEEGHSHNVYRDVSDFAESLHLHERSSWIAQERIHPVVQDGHVDELGIVGVFISHEDGVSCNSSLGYIVRSKPQHVDQGGVISGYAKVIRLCLIAN
jgi:hypothetical protein